MKIEQLQLDTLKDGVFCPNGACILREGNGNLDAWLDGGILRGRIAKDNEGKTLGFVLYYPIEMIPEPDGEGLYMVQCLHVTPAVDKAQTARALIDSAVADAFSQGGISLLATDVIQDANDEDIPATFVHNRGVNDAQSRGFTTLYYIVFKGEQHSPNYAGNAQSKLRVDILDCNHCYVDADRHEVVQDAVRRLDSKQVVNAPVRVQETVKDKQFSGGVFIDGKLIYFTGPTSEDDIMLGIEVADSARKREIDR
ncbi:MAG: hypothetical protein GX139_12760 [Armatimonadetes bacterium]|jgi:hypothetical protein|nr:hypothetical protein [Armatimonadota bacterium]